MKGPKDQKGETPNADECNFRLKEDKELEEFLESEYVYSEDEEEWQDSRESGETGKWMAAEAQAAYGIHAFREYETLDDEECPCLDEREKPWKRKGYKGPRLHEYSGEKNDFEEERFGGNGYYEYDREKDFSSDHDPLGEEDEDDRDRELKNEERYVQSVEDFEDYVDDKEAKFEYRQGYIYEMAGGSPDHAAIIANLMGEVRGRLRRKGRRCRAYSSDLMVHVADDDCIFLPDVSVICGPPKSSPTVPKAITNPVFLAEVLSPTTADRDRTDKFETYKLLPTFKEYLLVSQETYLVDRYLKNPYGEWKRTRYMSIDQEIKLQSLGITIPMELIYEDVEDLSDYFVVPKR